MSDVAPFLDAAVRTATPLLIASLGELVVERAGVINVGLEGAIVAGCYAAFATTVGGSSIASGYGAAMLAGCVLGIILAVFVVRLRRDQIVVGTTLTILALGITGTLFRGRAEEAAALILHVESAVRIPLLSSVPLLGRALFDQPMITYVAIALVPGAWLFLYRSHAGIALRAIGESPEAARAHGIPVATYQWCAVLFGSAFGGLAGASLVLAQAGSFAEGMSAGRGFLALAIVALGRWRPAGVLIASLIFGTAMALQFVVQSLGWRVRYELVLMIPYLLTLIALGAFGRGSAPAMLGRSTQSV